MMYYLPDETVFLKTMINVLDSEDSEQYKQMASILRKSKLSFDPSSQFTRRKWDYCWLDVVILAPLKYNQILQKSENKSILYNLAEQLLPVDCGYELYDIVIGILLEDSETAVAVDRTAELDEIPEIREGEIHKYNLKYGCLIGHKSCAETAHIVEKYDVRNVFLDISYDKRYVDYEEAIIEVLETAKLKPVLAKDTIQNQAMLCKICSFIRSCKYGIADISYPSLNVAYELGILHTLNKPIALFLNEGSSKPSDLLGLEHIPYSSAKNLKPLLAKWIINNVNEADHNALKFRYQW